MFHKDHIKLLILLIILNYLILNIILLYLYTLCSWRISDEFIGIMYHELSTSLRYNDDYVIDFSHLSFPYLYFRWVSKSVTERNYRGRKGTQIAVAIRSRISPFSRFLRTRLRWMSSNLFFRLYRSQQIFCAFVCCQEPISLSLFNLIYCTLLFFYIIFIIFWMHYCFQTLYTGMIKVFALILEDFLNFSATRYHLENNSRWLCAEEKCLWNPQESKTKIFIALVCRI